MRDPDQGEAEEHRELWELSLDDAMRSRWTEGRAKYGEVWRGRHPLVEAHEQIIDSLVYLKLAVAPYAVRSALESIAARLSTSIRDLRPGELERWTLGGGDHA